MGWRFRKSFKIFPGVRLNIGKKGITSATVGKRGVTTSVGKRGIFQNFGIPGTGLSYRNKVEGAGGIWGSVIVLGIVGFILVGVIALCAIFASVGRNSQQAEKPVPSRLATLPSSQPTAAPANLAANKSPRKNVKQSAAKALPTSRYIRGPRGGCYYINSSGKKTYVDHGKCS